jgi:hypothetical protein
MTEEKPYPDMTDEAQIATRINDRRDERGRERGLRWNSERSHYFQNLVS